MQANRTSGRGFFTAPSRKAEGELNRMLSETFDDHWTQPRLFYNSLSKTEQQFVINAMRFEASMIKSDVVRHNVITQLNRVSNEVASRVAEALGMAAPEPDATFYHDNRTAGVAVFGNKLPTVTGLKVAILATTADLSEATALKNALADKKISGVVVGEALADGVDTTYSGADATVFDGIVVTAAAKGLLDSSSKSTLYPVGRPGQILLDGFRWGKPVGGMGDASAAVFSATGASKDAPGVFEATEADALAGMMEEGLKTFKFLDRFPIDEGYE